MKTLGAGMPQCRFTILKSPKIAYIISPVQLQTPPLRDLAAKKQCNIAIIYGMDWNADLSPWPAPAAQKGAEPFAGNGPKFLHYLETELAPVVEKAIGITAAEQRTIIGVSLSGLFALWAWAQTDTFANVCSISGSLWYPGFTEWLGEQNLEAKRGKAYLSLGAEETATSNPLFATVGNCTAQVADIIKAAGQVQVDQAITKGGHRSPLEPRIAAALSAVNN